jgi:hypothetical protein
MELQKNGTAQEHFAASWLMVEFEQHASPCSCFWFVLIFGLPEECVLFTGNLVSSHVIACIYKVDS